VEPIVTLAAWRRRSYARGMVCSCCGEDRDEAMVASLLCHDEVKLCRICIGWLLPRAGGIDVTPTLPVADMDESIRFYERAGFDVERYDDGFAFAERHEQSAFNLNLNPAVDPATNGAGCYMIVPDVDGWHDRLVVAGLPVTAVEDMPWGMHEFTLTDPDGNHVRVGRSIDA
jgi:catechol 2,3-dioxygenase-like lactoylglutathione lyase family enzyme